MVMANSIKAERLCDRFEIELAAKLHYSEDLCVDSKIIEASRTGFKLSGNCNVACGELALQIEIPEIGWIDIKAEKVWHGSGSYGFRITKSHEAWEKFIAKLEK